MGVLRRIVDFVSTAASRVKDLVTLPTRLPQAVRESLAAFEDVMTEDWSSKPSHEKRETVSRVKKVVIGDLIPAAGCFSLMGAPGILVYTPCQIAGALAIAHVHDNQITKSGSHIKTVAAVMIWGKVGQFVWIQLADLLKSVLSPPVVGLAVIPYVQAWTEVALSAVDRHFGSTAAEDGQRDTNGPESDPNLTAAEAEESESGLAARDLLQQLRNGGRLLFDAQRDVFEELLVEGSQDSIVELGRAHAVRGVAGSGKTVLLGQLVPRLANAYRVRYSRWPRILVYHHNNFLRQLLTAEIDAALDRPIGIEPIAGLAKHRVREVHTLTTLLQSLQDRNLVGAAAINSIRSSDRAQAAIAALSSNSRIYDVILIDEAQDVTPQELDLLGRLVREDQSTGQATAYVFYDDLQNIFSVTDSVPQRLGQWALKPHFLERSVRTTKTILDLAVNTCLGPSLDQGSCRVLRKAMGLDLLHDRELIDVADRKDGQWIDTRFAVFTGDVGLDVREFYSNGDCVDGLVEQLTQLESATSESEAAVSKTLVVGFSTKTVCWIAERLKGTFGDRVALRSGPVDRRDKLRSLAVEEHRINVALVDDCKGYDADVVFVVNPDGQGGEPVLNRTRFYVAATRARQVLGVYSAVPPSKAPIMSDAMRAYRVLQSKGEGEFRQHG